jgi:hypothetical protein
MSYYVAIYNHQVTLFDDDFTIHNLQVKPFDDTDHSQQQVVLLDDICPSVIITLCRSGYLTMHYHLTALLSAADNS